MMASAALRLDQSCVQTRQDRSHDLSNRLHFLRSHSSAPSCPEQHGAEDMGSSTGARGRSLGGSYSNGNDARTQLQSAFECHVNEAPKVVARKVGASPDTVENHRQGVPQSWAGLIAYCRAYPALGLEVLELMGIDIDRDRNAYALFLQLQKQVRGE